MTAISVQIQPNRSPTMDAKTAVARLAALDERARVTGGVDTVRYISIDFAATDVAELWRGIRERLSKEPELSRAAIVVCEGQHGCDDYLLLHHYDRTLTLDTLNS
jgi:hypothetical protein